MFTSISLGLALMPFAVAKVWDVQVGGAAPTDLFFTPEALVSHNFAEVCFFLLLTMIFFPSPPLLEIKLSSISTLR